MRTTRRFGSSPPELRTNTSIVLFGVAGAASSGPAGASARAEALGEGWLVRLLNDQGSGNEGVDLRIVEINPRQR